MAFPMLAFGVGLQVGSSILGGLAASDAYNDKALQNRISAAYESLRASDEANIIRERGRRFSASQAAGFVKGGVLIDSGSPLAVLMDTAINVERNALRTMLYGSQRASQYEAAASAAEDAASAATITGILGGVSRGIEAYGIYADKYRPGSTPTRISPSAQGNWGPE